MSTALFLTYRSVGKVGEFPEFVESNGHKAILIQYPGERDSKKDEENFQVVDELLSKAKSFYKEPDYVVVYLPRNAVSRVLELVADYPPEKIGFVMCDCGLSQKICALWNSGSWSRIKKSFCGGQGEMKELLEHFLETGQVW